MELRIDSLAVESFHTAGGRAGRGTVAGHQCSCYESSCMGTCYDPGCYEPTCPGTCADTCGTCAVTCADSCGGTCFEATCEATCQDACAPGGHLTADTCYHRWCGGA